MISASEVKANVSWQALSWDSESLFDYQWTAHKSEYVFFDNTLNLDYSHEPAH